MQQTASLVEKWLFSLHNHAHWQLAFWTTISSTVPWSSKVTKANPLFLPTLPDFQNADGFKLPYFSKEPLWLYSSVSSLIPTRFSSLLNGLQALQTLPKNSSLVPPHASKHYCSNLFNTRAGHETKALEGFVKGLTSHSLWKLLMPQNVPLSYHL